jgi:uncharacterized protein
MMPEADEDRQNRNRALLAAVRSGDIAVFDNLVARHPTVLHMMTPFGTWLHVAAEAGQLPMVKHLLQLGLDINTRGGTFKGSAIRVAASSGQVEVVRHLLELRAYLDTSESERNPLFGAIYGGHTNVVEALLDAGIDATVRYSGSFMQGMDAIAFARERGQLGIVRILETRSKWRHQ